MRKIMFLEGFLEDFTSLVVGKNNGVILGTYRCLLLTLISSHPTLLQSVCG
jgi:hypothetical protein